tara:strand:- start:112 stop:294 length:183 start_codon:yes stop_codon:yes gene_type:complete
MKKVLWSIYDDGFFDINCNHYGPAITTSFKEDGEIWVTNGEYISKVNYCPFTGEKAENET